MKLIVHFGMPKTGTSSIQRSLHAALDSADFHYLSTGTANLNRTLINGFRANASQHFTNRFAAAQIDEAAASREAQSALSQSIREGGDRTAILSSEYLTSQARPEFERLADFLRTFYASTLFIGYVRKPKAYMESAFQQTLKVQFRPFGEKDSPVRYRQWLGKFYAYGGDSTVLLRPFERPALRNGCVVQDFCATLGIPFDPARVMNVNESISLPAVQLLYAYRKFGQASLQGRGAPAWRANLLLVERLRTLAGKRFSIHSTVYRSAMQGFMDEVGWAEERLGSSLAEDIEAGDDAAIRDEAGMLQIGEEQVAWLNAQLAPAEQADAKTPEEIAALVGTLCEKLLRETAKPRRTPRVPQLAV